MPGRVSARNRASNLDSVDRLATPGRTGREFSPRIEAPDEGPVTELRTRICGIFGDVQRTTAGHRKLVVNLRKIQDACSSDVQPSGPGRKASAGFDEGNFNSEFTRCVLRSTIAKKSEHAGDRLVRFVGLFLKHASDRDNAHFPQAVEDDTALPETQTTRLTSLVLSTLLQLLNSKEKTIRYRATQIISHIINSLDSIDDELFGQLKLSLLKRIRDKESMVRVQAVLGLGRLAGNEAEEDEDNDDSEEESAGLLDRLLEVLQNDSSADVRKALLLNLPLTPETLPFLLGRARDQDAATRRALYSRLLPALGDFRHLSLSMREKLLRWGLRDRDENVRKATSKLFRERWIEDCAGAREPTEEGAPVEAAPPSFDALTELLERIDVSNSGVENGIAHEAMKGFWEGRADYRDSVDFDQHFWDSLTTESAFMARTFNAFCRLQSGGKYESLIDGKMPEVTALAFILQRYVNDLIEGLRKSQASQNEEDEDEESLVELEFIVEQLLHIVLTLDYSDEVGRRKMYSLLRETLTLPELPEEVTRLSVEVLRGICGPDSAAEREFCEIVLEAVAEVHDTIMGDGLDPEESFHSARSEVSLTPTQSSRSRSQTPAETPNEEEKAIKEIVVNMKCLHLAQCMLENVSEPLKSHIPLVTMLNNLVVPAVRSHEAPIRERGLLCLGLCCLLDRELAEENLTLFQHIFTKGHDALQVSAIHVLSDTFLSHGPSLFHPSSTVPASPAPDFSKPFTKLFTKALKAEDKPSVQAAASTAIAKLMLSNVVQDDDLLKTLVVAYFDPGTLDNLALRQSLTYFLPVYCYSRAEHQARMRRVAVAAIHALALIEESVDEEEEMVGLGVIAAHLVDWTDPRKVVTAGGAGDNYDGALVSMFDEAGRKEVKPINCDVHLDFATDVLEKLLASGISKEEKKTLASTLGKLYLSPSYTAEKLDVVRELAEAAARNRVFTDATSRNALNKLTAAIAKVVGAVSARQSEARTLIGDGENCEGVELDRSRETVEKEEEESLDDAPGAQLLAEAARDSTPRKVTPEVESMLE
ncbi:MAG: hypothetical protein M1814_005706 [Vezdaea aestivalis]|nr:MAG: hypothetical protein M1814_005706 [Vezdaea aestivalis]